MPELARRDFLRFINAATWSLAGIADWRLAPARQVPPLMFDTDGLIVHRGMDGGDTAQREGWYWVGAWVREHVLNDPWPFKRRLSFDEVLGLLEPAKDGIFHRHPKLPPWNNPHDKAFGLSRDQMVPLVAAMGLWQRGEPLRRLWDALPQDPGTGIRHTFNGKWIELLGQRVWHEGDVVGPMTVNLFRRAWGEDPNRQGVINGREGEEELRANVLLRNGLAAQDADDVGDDLNLIVMLLMAFLRFPSEQSQSAAEIYKTRSHSFGSYLDQYRTVYGVDLSVPPGEIRRRIEVGRNDGWPRDTSAHAGAVRWYHLEEFGANPALSDLYDPIVRHYFG